ncbi:MAG: diaminopimelate epimerase [Bdellovibrionota bacterium]
MTNPTDFSFLKISAAGNKFLIADGNPKFPVISDVVRILCQNQDGYKPDGVLWLERTSNESYKWHFYNADGSSAEMCGNAACGAVYYLKLKNFSEHGITFETISGPVSTFDVKDPFPLNCAVSVWMPKILKDDVSASVDGQPLVGVWIDSGVPHVVIEKPLVKYPTDSSWERKVRLHPMFGNKGTNVTYVFNTAKGVKAISYERGVEAFTDGCGTGALAAAFSTYRKQSPAAVKTAAPISVEMPGGTLKVTFLGRKAILQSPVKFHGLLEPTKG